MCKSAVLSVFLLLGSAAFAQSDAQQQYAKTCSMCHGADGKGQTSIGKTVKAADLTSPAIQSKSDADLYNTISKGRGKMAAYGDILGKQKIEALVKYIRTMKK